MPLTTYAPGDVLTASSLNANLTSAAASGGLTFVAGGSFGTVTSISTGAVFTAAFQNYLVLFRINASASDQDVFVRFNAAGSPVTSANYFGCKIHGLPGGTVAATGTSTQTSFNLSATNTGNPFVGLSINVFAPAVAATKSQIAYTGFDAQLGVNVASNTGGALFNVTGAHDGLTFFTTSTVDGNFRVYGYSDS